MLSPAVHGAWETRRMPRAGGVHRDCWGGVAVVRVDSRSVAEERTSSTRRLTRVFGPREHEKQHVAFLRALQSCAARCDAGWPAASAAAGCLREQTRTGKPSHPQPARHARNQARGLRRAACRRKKQCRRVLSTSVAAAGAYRPGAGSSRPSRLARSTIPRLAWPEQSRARSPKTAPRLLRCGSQARVRRCGAAAAPRTAGRWRPPQRRSRTRWQ